MENDNSIWPLYEQYQEERLRYLYDEYNYRLAWHPRAEKLAEDIRAIARKRNVQL